MIDLGLDTFGDVTIDAGGQPLHQAQVLRHLVEEAVLADRIGLHFFGVGEHHRPDFAVSAPEVVLAAIAGRTSRIHLGSAVTVLNQVERRHVATRLPYEEYRVVRHSCGSPRPRAARVLTGACGRRGRHVSAAIIRAAT